MMRFAVAAACAVATARAASPWGPGPAQQAAALVAQMSTDQKVSLVHGYGSVVGEGNYVGWTTGIPSLGVPLMNLEDGPQGVADEVGNVTCWPSALTVVQSWDRGLMYQYGQAMGKEQSIKGSTVMLGPGVNLARIPWGGRNFEYQGEDPFLASQMVVPEVQGIQSNGISGCIKHYVFNNQEHNRNSVSANVPDRAAKELYFVPFHAAVDAGVGTAMCSYNRVNNTYACENNATLNTELKSIGGFAGWVMSDWGAAHSTVGSAFGGLDMEQPNSVYFGPALAAAVANGSVNMSTLDGMVTRILTTHYALGMMGGPKGNLQADARSAAHTALARDLAANSAVLLKNSGGMLPLDAGALKTVAVLGDAFTVHGYGSGGVYPGGYISTPYQGLYEALNLVPPPTRPACALSNSLQYMSNSSTCIDAPSLDFCPVICASDPACDYFSYDQGQQCNGWGTPGGQCWPMSGPATPQQSSNSWTSGACPQASAPAPRVTVTSYAGSDMSKAAALAAAADVAVISLATACSEGEDRANLDLPDWQNQLVAAVAAVQPKVVVVLRTPGPVLMPWLSQVPAVLLQLMPGQEAGNALADNLLGLTTPSGKLAVSFPTAMNATWLGSGQGQWPTNQTQYPGTDRGKGWPEADYSEGLYFGYRWYDAQGAVPLFPFGHGLSYTSWGYSNLAVAGSMSAGNGGQITVTATLTNAGSYTGAEVAQLYVGFPAAAQEPPKLLRGFAKTALQPGKSTTLSFTLLPKDVQIWDVVAQSWTVVPGPYTVLLGSSSADIRVTGQFSVSA